MFKLYHIERQIEELTSTVRTKQKEVDKMVRAYVLVTGLPILPINLAYLYSSFVADKTLRTRSRPRSRSLPSFPGK